MRRDPKRRKDDRRKSPEPRKREPVREQSSGRVESRLRRITRLIGQFWRPGELVLGRYNIEKILGSGSLERVYLLSDTEDPRQKFAVKKVAFQDETLKNNFLKELQIWMDLPNFPYLVACLFVQTVFFEEAIFMEYVEGGSLKELIKKVRSAPSMIYWM